MIRYEIKVFDKSWNYITTINPNVVMNDVSFSETTNWWQWQMSLNLALDFGDTTFHWWEIVKVILYSERYKQGKQIYYWYVSQVARIYDINKWYIRIICLWIASLLTKIMYSWNYEWTAQELLTAIIWKFNTEYSWNLINIWTIDPYEWTISLSLEQNITCSKAIDKIAEICNYYWFVDSEWTFTFKQKFTQTNHILANQKVVENIELNYNIESLTNKFFLERKDWTVKTYENTTSQNLYWIKEQFQKQTSLESESTQDDFWNSYIEQYSSPKNASKVVVNSEYNIESIIPWDTITIVNTTYEIKNLVIEKINYTPNRITLTLEENESIRWIISS